MQDANELATILEADDAFDASGSVNLAPLRAGEATSGVCACAWKIDAWPCSP